MPRYLYLGRYAAEGCRGVIAEGGTHRETETRAVVEQVGGTVELYQFAFAPDVDFVIVAEMPDSVSALVPPLLAASTGTVEVRGIPLMPPSDVDAATQVARSVVFRAAGS